ncbi:MAG: hypothetical protein K8R88_00370 [Armatimonadetes bacterium]|nr:hypothetical protein [Armatimonadota bacterium]
MKTEGEKLEEVDKVDQVMKQDDDEAVIRAWKQTHQSEQAARKDNSS